MHLNNFKSFAEAGTHLLNFLSQHFSFRLWMITRTEGNNWIVLQSKDMNHQIQSGQVFNWADSFCYHMIESGAPKISPSSSTIPFYKNAPINHLIKINAYIGQPILKEDGSLFGTLCAVDPNPQSEDILKEAKLIELLGSLLSNILQAELREQEQIRQTERFKVAAFNDSLTGVLNRRAWDELIDFEEKRCQKYGNSIAVLVIDLNNLKTINDQLGHFAGDEFIKKAALTLKSCIRNTDIIARLGGDEFGILFLDTNLDSSKPLVQKIKRKLKRENISAAIGCAIRDPSQGIIKAIESADLKMYAHKLKSKKP